MKKRGIIVLALIMILIIGGLLGRQFWQPDPVKLVGDSLKQLNATASFRFSVTQQQWVEGKERLLTQIQGEKDGGNTRTLGQLVGSEVEMILIGDTLYSKDPFSKKWIKFNSSPAAQEVFLAELNPLSSLQINELGEVVLSGQEKINGDKTWVCNFTPTVQNEIMEEFWQDFNYTVYIRKSDKMIVKTIIQAKSKSKTEPMRMILDFQDFGKKIVIQAPSV